ncbi:MAG: 2-dehydropantoate 2-reductase [Chloroflexi bacterium]|nr:2-dehydropantoate 2-reductase [Chloroflexota bacterium]
MTGKKMAVLGVGAIGSVVGGFLTKAGNDVTLIDQWPEHVETMKRNGLRIGGTAGDHLVKVRAVHLCDVSTLNEQFDIVFLAVKSYDTRWAVSFILPYLKPDGFIVSTQNSINDEWIAPIVGYTRDIACIVTLGAGLYEPGHVTRTGDPERIALTLGELHCRVTPRLQELANIMSAVGKTRTTTNTWGERWAKLGTNSMGNAMGGLTGLGSAAVRSTPETRRIIIKIGAEVVRVGHALGVNIEPISGVPAQDYVDAAEGRGLEELEMRLMEHTRDRGEGRASLLQDVMKGRKTEADYLNGYVAARGKEVGVPTPVCVAITELVHEVERGQRRSHVSNVKDLERFL